MLSLVLRRGFCLGLLLLYGRLKCILLFNIWKHQVSILGNGFFLKQLSPPNQIKRLWFLSSGVFEQEGGWQRGGGPGVDALGESYF